MTTTAAPEAVWDVLADGWLYPAFVVGAARMRAVDGAWPGVGSRLHHSAGTWTGLIDDETEVLASEPPGLLRLRAHGWPAGSAEVAFRLQSRHPGTVVVLEEDVVAGPGRLIPASARRALLRRRNAETLLRLRYLAEGRHESE